MALTVIPNTQQVPFADFERDGNEPEQESKLKVETERPISIGFDSLFEEKFVGDFEDTIFSDKKTTYGFKRPPHPWLPPNVQKKLPMPWKICKMNLALRGAEGDIQLGDSYHDDKFANLRAKYVVSNPPFNDSGWGADRIKYEDPRFDYGVPPDNNANFAWIQHYLYHMNSDAKAGYVMANGALSGGNLEGEIRKKILEKDLVYGIVACPTKLFYNVQLAVSLWFLRKTKPEKMKGKVLLVYAKKMYKPVSRRQVVFTAEQKNRITEKFRAFERGDNETDIDEVTFAKVAKVEDIIENSGILTPGRYVGIEIEEDELDFEQRIKLYTQELSKLLENEDALRKNAMKVVKTLSPEEQNFEN